MRRPVRTMAKPTVSPFDSWWSMLVKELQRRGRTTLGKAQVGPTKTPGANPSLTCPFKVELEQSHDQSKRRSFTSTKTLITLSALLGYVDHRNANHPSHQSQHFHACVPVSSPSPLSSHQQQSQHPTLASTLRLTLYELAPIAWLILFKIGALSNIAISILSYRTH